MSETNTDNLRYEIAKFFASEYTPGLTMKIEHDKEYKSVVDIRERIFNIVDEVLTEFLNSISIK